jgi:hypothetical protein
MMVTHVTKRVNVIPSISSSTYLHGGKDADKRQEYHLPIPNSNEVFQRVEIQISDYVADAIASQAWQMLRYLLGATVERISADNIHIEVNGKRIEPARKMRGIVVYRFDAPDIPDGTFRCVRDGFNGDFSVVVTTYSAVETVTV